MKNNKKIVGMRLLLMCIALLVGCSPATPAPTATNLPSTQTPIPPTSTLPASATPLPSLTPIPALSPGTYKMTLTAQEAGRFSPLDLSGEWLVTLHPNDNSTGTIAVSVNGSITQFGTGTYTLNVDAHQVTIVLEICGKSDVGLYHWTFDGVTLVLKSIADQCGNRVFLMEVHPWTRQP